MLKKIFNILNNMIQWSKKYHFFHILAILNFFFVAHLFWFLTLLCLIAMIPIKCVSNIFGEGVLGFLLFIFILIILQFILLFISLIIQIVICIKNRKKGTIQISSPFLLNNKFYNFCYIYAHITITVIIAIVLYIPIQSLILLIKTKIF